MCKNYSTFSLFNMYFFFQSSIWALFSYISINYIKSGYAATLFWHCSYNVFYSTVQFWWAVLFLVLNNSYSISGTVATVVTVFFYLLFVLFIFYIYCYIDTINFTIFSQLLRCQFLLSQNKIIKYETVTNHN